MAEIHRTAFVETTAELADDVQVGPFCHIGDHVKIGARTKLISHVCILGPTTIGEDNVIHPHTSLGGAPQDLKYSGGPTQLIVGDRNMIRENVTMHRGTEHGGGITQVGSDNLFMAGCHIAHDCKVGNEIRMANNVLLAGHIKVEDRVILLGAMAAHHFTTIGCYAYVSGMTRLKHDVPPYMTVEGYHARVRALNTVGLERGGVPEESIERLKDAYFWLYRSTRANVEQTGVATIADALDKVENLYGQDSYVRHLIDSIRRSNNGRGGRAMEKPRFVDTAK